MQKTIFFFFCFILICTTAGANKAVFAQIEKDSLGADIKKYQRQVGDAYSPENVGLETSDQKNVLTLYRLILGRFTALLAIFFFIYTIVGGFQWMMAGGNEEKVSEAKKKIINGMIGVGIVLAAYIITYFVFSQISKVTGVKTGF